MSKLATQLGGRLQSAGRGWFRWQQQQQRLVSNKLNRPDAGSQDGPTSYLLLVVPLTAFGLGTWQVFRRQWKLDLIKHLEERTSAAPASLPSNLEELDDMEYRSFRLRGTFEHDKEMFVGPRSLISHEDPHIGSGLLSTGQSGYNVVTPFRLADSNVTVLVNRGFVSRKKLEAASRQSGQTPGVVDLVGVYRRHENRPQFVPQNQQGSTMFHYRDVHSMARLAGAAPLFFDADAECPGGGVDGGPVGGQTLVTLRNEHASYIVTWYSLAALTALLWHRRFVRKLPLM